MMNLMRVGGGLMALLGLVLALVNFAAPGQMQVMGLTPEAAFTLLAGGMVAMGLGGVIRAIEAAQSGQPVHLPQHSAGSTEEILVTEPAPVVTAAPVVEPPAPARVEVQPAAIPAAPEDRMAAFRRERFTGFRRHLGDAAGSTLSGAGAAATAVAATAVAGAEAAASTAHDHVSDTIAALEKAKSDINAALGAGSDSIAEAVTEVEERAVEEEVPVAEPEVAAEAEAPADGELYVVEEKIVRGRPARVLSDGTVEAETDEGWMRFENFEHLDEYLDATAPDMRG